MGRTVCRAMPVRGRHALSLAVLAACLTITAIGALAAELTFPALTGRVVDAAGILTPEQRGTLEAKLKAHEDKTSDQVVVATVPNLQGTTVEDYANRLFRDWKLGQAKTDNGVLLLVAPSERKVRIEVGYGLEGALTDALSKVIIAGAITPRFKTGDYFGGLDAGVDGIFRLGKDAGPELKKGVGELGERASHGAPAPPLPRSLAPFLCARGYGFQISAAR